MRAMVTFESRKNVQLKIIKVDMAIFNGLDPCSLPGYNNFKDIIFLVTIKPQTISKNITLGAGGSI